jgi:hypothetical protein
MHHRHSEAQSLSVDLKVGAARHSSLNLDCLSFRCGPSVAGAVDPDDPGLLAASAWPHGAQLRHLATTLPQELRLLGIRDLDPADAFLRGEYIAEFNRKFAVPAAQKGYAFVRLRRKDLDWIFSAQLERTVNQDNTIQLDNRAFQLEHNRWRNTLAGQPVVVHEYLDGRVSIRYGPNLIAPYRSDELPPRRRNGGANRDYPSGGRQLKSEAAGTRNC